MTLHDQIAKQLNSEVEPGKEYFERPEVYEKEILQGINWEVLKYGHVMLDEHAPYKQGQLTTIVGNTNVGKTTLIIYLLTRLMAQDKKLIIYSAENRIAQLARYILQFNFKNKYYNRYFDWLKTHVLFIKHIKQYTYKDMLEQIGVSQDIGFNPDMLFIDPYNSLKKDSKKNDHNYDYEAIEDFRIFTQNTKVSIFLNCHTNTEAQRVKPDKNGETPRPISADVEGGGKFLNKSDDVWVIHRHLHHMDKEERYVSHLYIDKVRNTEGGGYPTPYHNPVRFKFNKDWTGFTTTEDKISDSYREQNGSLIPYQRAVEIAEKKSSEDLPF